MASLAESQATPPLDALAESQPRNPFTDVVAWDPFPPIAFKPDDSVFDRESDPDVSESLRATFRAFAAYANDDGVLALGSGGPNARSGRSTSWSCSRFTCAG